MTENEFKSFDQKRIFYREWECGDPVGVVQIVHGMAESSARYDRFARALNERGIAVFCDDHRGHGETDGRSGYCEGDIFHDTLRDVALLTDIARKKYPIPLVLFGHSYGSFLTQSYLENYGEKIDGAIVGGSAYFHDLQVPAGRAISSLACLFGREKKAAELITQASFGAYNKKFRTGTFISSVEEECKKYEEHPDCNFTLSYGFYRSFFGGVSDLYRKKSVSRLRKDIPILLIAGEEDPVGGMGKLVKRLYRFYRDAGVGDLSLVLYPGVRHEYLNDVSREKATEEIASFAERVFAGNREKADG